VGIHDVAARFFINRLAGSWVPQYLAGRGFGPEVQRRWQVGYAPATRDGLVRHLRAAGYADSLIVAAGLARRSRRGYLTDIFRDRAVVPIRSARGSIVAFVGRRAEHAEGDSPRYLNSPSTFRYEKGLMLFGLWEARESLAAGAVPVIVEGPLDVLAVALAGGGRFAPVSPCGTALTSPQAQALDRAGGLATSGVLVAFDGDESGRRAAMRAYRVLSPYLAGSQLARLPAGSDPASLLADGGPGALAAALAHRTRPLADLVVDAELANWRRWLEFAEGRVSALRAIAPTVAAMPAGDVGRQVGRLAVALGLPHAVVTEAVTEALTAGSASAGAAGKVRVTASPCGAFEVAVTAP
jgi:DNA primase